MMNKKKQACINIDIDAYKKIVKFGDGAGMTVGVLNLLSFCENVLRISTIEIKHFFTPDEWKAIAASLNGTLVDEFSRYRVDMFIAHCEDSELLEKTFSQFNVDIEKFVMKANKLTCAQLVAVYDRVEDFWQNSNKYDLEKWSQF